MSTEPRFEHDEFEDVTEEVNEAALWAEWMLRHDNIAFRGAAGFLISLYGFEVDGWVAYFAQHSHPALREIARRFPEWYPWMLNLGCFKDVPESDAVEHR